MHTELKLHQVSPERLLSDYVERRLYFGLSRFGERIGRVTTKISGSVEKSQEMTCRIIADVRPFGLVSAEASDADVYMAIDRCIGRLTRRCKSKCARSKSRPGRASIRLPQHMSAA